LVAVAVVALAVLVQVLLAVLLERVVPRFQTPSQVQP
jgi:hypothetical protein